MTFFEQFSSGQLLAKSMNGIAAVESLINTIPMVKNLQINQILVLIILIIFFTL